MSFEIQESFRVDFADRLAQLTLEQLEEYEELFEMMPERELELLYADLKHREQQLDREPVLV